jgi:hypothetical protein
MNNVICNKCGNNINIKEYNKQKRKEGALKLIKAGYEYSSDKYTYEFLVYKICEKRINNDIFEFELIHDKIHIYCKVNENGSIEFITKYDMRKFDGLLSKEFWYYIKYNKKKDELINYLLDVYNR